MKRFTPSSDIVPLLAAALPSLALTLVNLVRQRGVDLLGIGVLLGLATGGVLIVSGADPRFLLLRESIITGVLGGACLISLLFHRPLVYWILKYLSTGGNLSVPTLSDALWDQASVRSTFRRTTLVLSLILLLELVLRAYLVFKLNINTSLIVLPLLFRSIQGVTILWVVLSLRATIRRGRHSVQQAVTAPLIEEKSYR